MKDTENIIKKFEEEIIRQIDKKGVCEDIPNVRFDATDALEVLTQLRFVYEIVIALLYRCKASTREETCNICKYQETCFKERAKRNGVRN